MRTHKCSGTNSGRICIGVGANKFTADTGNTVGGWRETSTGGRMGKNNKRTGAGVAGATRARLEIKSNPGDTVDDDGVAWNTGMQEDTGVDRNWGTMGEGPWYPVNQEEARGWNEPVSMVTVREERSGATGN